VRAGIKIKLPHRKWELFSREPDIQILFSRLERYALKANQKKGSDEVGSVSLIFFCVKLPDAGKRRNFFQMDGATTSKKTRMWSYANNCYIAMKVK